MSETPWDNPAGMDGFAFVEFAHEAPEQLMGLFKQMGFDQVFYHPGKDLWLYQQADIRFLIHTAQDAFAQTFKAAHGPCAPSMGFWVNDPSRALAHVISQGAQVYEQEDGEAIFDVPVIRGIGDSLLYLMPKANEEALFTQDFEVVSAGSDSTGLKVIDHLTHNVYQGQMDEWAEFYHRLFGFREIRYFDINGRHTGLLSRALESPCHRVKIPLNESKDPNSQIAEYLDAYKGEGIQHIALSTGNIYETVALLRDAGTPFLSVPETYYGAVNKRIPNHGEDLKRLCDLKILIDGDPENGEGLLLQIFTQNVIGPLFFEVIQRKGNEGFGEGNFTALFESIERDQMARGVLKDKDNS